MKHPDIIIIGAGLMGAATALNLARDGKKVVLLEKEVSGIHASAVNAGGVRRLNRAFEEIPISAAAGEMWPKLEKIVGNDCGFEPVGQVRIGQDDGAVAVFEERINKIEAMGFYHEELVDKAEIKRLVPAYTGNCAGGMVTRSDGHAMPAETIRAFFDAARREGVEAVTGCKVTNISRGKNGFTVQAEDGHLFSSEIVINCAGAWGKNIAALIDDQLPIEPVALSMMVAARMKRFLTPVVGVHGRKLSFKQMANGTVVIGGGHRALLNMDNERTMLNISEMKTSAATVTDAFPIMKKATIVRLWAGIEGMVSDGLPIIGESVKTPGFFHVCGFSSHGFQLSPMVGQLAASLVLGKKPELSLDPFSLNRFQKPD